MTVSFTSSAYLIGTYMNPLIVNDWETYKSKPLTTWNVKILENFTKNCLLQLSQHLNTPQADGTTPLQKFFFDFDGSDMQNQILTYLCTNLEECVIAELGAYSWTAERDRPLLCLVRSYTRLFEFLDDKFLDILMRQAIENGTNLLLSDSYKFFPNSVYLVDKFLMKNDYYEKPPVIKLNPPANDENTVLTIAIEMSKESNWLDLFSAGTRSSGNRFVNFINAIGSASDKIKLLDTVIEKCKNQQYPYKLVFDLFVNNFSKWRNFLNRNLTKFEQSQIGELIKFIHHIYKKYPIQYIDLWNDYIKNHTYNFQGSNIYKYMLHELATRASQTISPPPTVSRFEFRPKKTTLDEKAHLKLLVDSINQCDPSIIENLKEYGYTS